MTRPQHDVEGVVSCFMRKCDKLGGGCNWGEGFFALDSVINSLLCCGTAEQSSGIQKLKEREKKDRKQRSVWLSGCFQFSICCVCVCVCIGYQECSCSR